MPHADSPKTIDDYYALPADDRRTELIDGAFVVSPAPGLRHQLAVVALAAILHRQVRALKAGIVLTGPFDVILSRTNIPHPDVLFISSASRSRLTDTLQGPPDLAVEFLSPSNPGNDLKRKMRIYLENGVPQYWIGDPKAGTIRVLENGGTKWLDRGTFKGGDVIRPAGMPGVEIAVSEVYEVPA